MGLESVLLGAHAEGIRNVLAVTGDPPEVGDYPGSGGVYEVDSIGLTRLISHLNRGENYNGKAIDAPTSFFIGVAVNPNADDPELELDRFRRKVDEGASFAMTQIVFDLDDLDRFMARLGGPSPVPVLARRLPADELPARAPAAQRGARDRRPGGAAGSAARRGLTGGGGRLRARARADRRSARPVSRASTSSRRTGSRSRVLELLARLSSGRAAPVSTGAVAVASTLRTTSAGTPYPPGSPIFVANTIVCTRPSLSIAGPPELPCRIDAGQARDRPIDRALARRRRRSARARSCRSARARCRAARSAGSRRSRRGGRARARPSRSGRAAEPGHAQDGDVVLRVERRPPRRRGACSEPGSTTDVLRSPATTCAAVTTRPGAATQPLPEIPSPHAVPRTRTTLARGGAHVGVAGDLARWARPGSAGRRSTGTDRHGRARSAAAPAGRSRSAAAAPRSAARPGAASAGRGAGAQLRRRSRRAPSRRPRRGRGPPRYRAHGAAGSASPPRKNEPAIDPSASSTAAPITAPARATSGAYGECAPPLSTAGAIRAPITAPATMPVIASRLATSPFRSPTKPPSTTTASAIQSSRPTWAG